MEQVRICADRREDVIRLARCFDTAATTNYPALLAFIHDAGLMRFPLGAVSPLVWLVRKTRGRAGLMAFFQHLQRRRPDLLSAAIRETAEHVGWGIDLEDETSVGGWSQREIDLFQATVQFTDLTPECEDG